ncbi:MAG: hypothetical protein HZA46_12945 [Planctomycetales bacterium]|nr:hypothetical protein [Planctomycetales bacterium]
MDKTAGARETEKGVPRICRRVANHVATASVPKADRVGMDNARKVTFAAKAVRVLKRVRAVTISVATEMSVETTAHVRKAHRVVMGNGLKVTCVAKAVRVLKRVRVVTISVAKEMLVETVAHVRKARPVVIGHVAKENRDRNRSTSSNWISKEK